MTVVTTAGGVVASPYPALNIPETDIYALVIGSLGPAEAALPAVTELTTGTSVTYGELKAMADAIAGELHSRGIGPGDVVTLQVPNSINFAAALLGIAKLGAIVNPIGMLMNQADVSHIIEASSSKLYIGPTDMEAVPQIFSMELPSIITHALAAPDVAVDPASIAVVPFSSGTTGLPKGVVLTHRNLVANILQSNDMLARNGVRRGAKTLAVLPFSHIYGFTIILLGPLLNRQHLYTLPKFDMDHFLRAHDEYGIELTFAAPPMAIPLAKDPAINPEWFANLDLLMCGAAPLSEATLRAVEERLNTRVIQGWGMTEASPLVTANVRHETSPSSVGKPIPNTELRIVDPDTLEDLAPGDRGEVLVRGPQVMSGYLNNDEANAATLIEGGWLRTGDIAYFDEDMDLHIVDRAKEVIKYKGYQVAPAELEALILTHPAVKDVGVVGVERDGLEIPRAFVVKQDGAELGEAELMGWVADRVTPYKKVRAVDFIDAIPKNPSGKILRRELRSID
ncbi:AMP-binding protein [Corynebacterium liangguodongii]|uniref:Acyl-CoA synthetase n=1 Tax=Corynebacterium liangguodongii TaxID=2079535 RepID=A0A2S0WFF6_9CORY|nr:AMP-binding protein [Corynebacterium liangguodongii]AWB84517.1 acyl-CoA synthetase [Corynebacterium liangguodongii]PWB98899.1 acyl-CoA synthetase [Corynebacterium liangguodongii]